MEHEFPFGTFRPEKQDYLVRRSVATRHFPQERRKKSCSWNIGELTAMQQEKMANLVKSVTKILFEITFRKLNFSLNRSFCKSPENVGVSEDHDKTRKL